LFFSAYSPLFADVELRWKKFDFCWTIDFDSIERRMCCLEEVLLQVEAAEEEEPMLY
jgi:hypothetical protein